MKTDNTISVFITQTDFDSLDDKYDGTYVKKNKEDIEAIFETSYEILGTDFYAEGICACKNPDFHVLYTAENHFGSPVICGNCACSIPILPLRKQDKTMTAKIILLK